jgi:hypothetical protein
VIDVYWNSYAEMSKGVDLLSTPPVLVTKDLREDGHIRSKGFEEYTHCPSYSKFFQNTYVVKSNFDLTIEHNVDDNGNVWVNLVGKDQQFFNNNITITDYEKEQQLVRPTLFNTFFSEKDVDISITPAFMHVNGFTENAMVPAGGMSISKWFMPLQTSFFMKSSVVDIKVGDALYYIKFNTGGDPIRFKHFDMSDKLKEFQKECLGVRNFKGKMGLSRLYNLFTRKNYNKKIVDEIKKNLTGDFE